MPCFLKVCCTVILVWQSYDKEIGAGRRAWGSLISPEIGFAAGLLSNLWRACGICSAFPTVCPCRHNAQRCFSIAVIVMSSQLCSCAVKKLDRFWLQHSRGCVEWEDVWVEELCLVDSHWGLSAEGCTWAHNFIWTNFADEADLCYRMAAKYAMISLPAVVMSVMLKTFVSILISASWACSWLPFDELWWEAYLTALSAACRICRCCGQCEWYRLCKSMALQLVSLFDPVVPLSWLLMRRLSAFRLAQGMQLNSWVKHCDFGQNSAVAMVAIFSDQAISWAHVESVHGYCCF